MGAPPLRGRRQRALRDRGAQDACKVCLVVRREREGIKRYVHLSTGNYNEKTVRLYSDIGYLTSNEDLASDISAFFNMITGYSQPASWEKIEVAPYGLGGGCCA